MGRLVIQAHLAPHLGEVHQLGRVMSQDPEEAVHGLILLELGDVTDIPSQEGLQVAPRPHLTPVLVDADLDGLEDVRSSLHLVYGDPVQTPHESHRITQCGFPGCSVVQRDVPSTSAKQVSDESRLSALSRTGYKNHGSVPQGPFHLLCRETGNDGAFGQFLAHVSSLISRVGESTCVSAVSSISEYNAVLFGLMSRPSRRNCRGCRVSRRCLQPPRNPGMPAPRHL